MANAICLLNDMCRLCLDKPGTQEILENDQLIQDIFLCTGVQISSLDTLPQKICSACNYKIGVSIDLRRYSITNDLYMKSLMENNTEELHEIARPKVLLVIPSEKAVSSSTESQCKTPNIDKQKKKRENMNEETENMKLDNKRKTKISVRSLADINASLMPMNSSSEKSGDSHKKKSCDSTSLEDSKTVTKKYKCDSSSTKCNTSGENKSKRNVSVRNNLEINEEYKCEICKKTYQNARKLYMHRRSHTKLLHCPLDACGKSFATKGDLQKHIRSHTGEKPYKCDLCDKSFTQNVTLKSHKETVHVEKMT